MATEAQVKAFIAMIAPIAVRQAAKHGNKPFVSVCIAQACCESAYGTSPKMVKANAVFGIKVGKTKPHFGTAWKDKAYSTKTKECYDGRTYTEIEDFFRAYDSVEDSVEDYFDLLCTAKRYQYALNQPTPLACITGIQKAPYATSPTYISTIMGIINKYGLTIYDGPAGASAAQAVPYVVGQTYTLMKNMYVRNAPKGENLSFDDLTEDGKAHSLQDENGIILRQTTRVTVREIREIDGAVWIRIPSGWICGRGASGTVYVA
ncbi:MAG: glucosaminidase domain-containing protein [Lachnospiraceae bacterium]|nr:glucosaminidase domain-containing protein [Lachnospiraceae bacterium]